MYYTYIAHCADKTFYTGYCRNLKCRESTHNKGLGAKYTRGRTPVKIVYSEKFLNKSDAMKREVSIKKLPRKRKEQLINKKPAT